MSADRVERLLFALEAWAVARDDVHAVVVVGSQARPDLPADRFADVDVLLVVDAPGPFLDDTRWLHAFGTPVLTFLEPTAVGGQTERRVLYDDGQDVDFAVVPLSDAEIPAAAGRVLARGFRVVVDKVSLEERLRAAADAAGAEAPPTPAEFEQVVHDFWYHLILAAKKLARGEIFHAKQICDCYCKSLLVEMVEWRQREAGVPTWHGSRLFERWCGEDVLEDLAVTFARYDGDDVERALRATGALFERVASAYAARHDFPPSPHEAARAQLDAVRGRS